MADINIIEDEIDDEEIDEEIMHARGRKPKPCWIDGEKINSIAEAKEKLGIHSADMDEFYYCSLNGHIFRGHVIRMTEPKAQRPPRKVRTRAVVKEHRFGEPLLVGHCKHRLGAYTGGKW